MPLKQQTLAASLNCRTTRRITRMGSHNCNWDAVVSEDIMELLVDGAIMDGDKYWTTLRNMRSVSKAFYHVVNAKLDALLAELKNKADAARRELELLVAESGYPRWGELDERNNWTTRVHELRDQDPVTYSAYDEYKDLLRLYFADGIVFRLLKYNRTSGFWIHRDELFAWRFDACIKCRGKHGALADVNTYHASFDNHMWMVPCHQDRQTCCPIRDFEKNTRTRIDRQADLILNVDKKKGIVQPATKALWDLWDAHQCLVCYWVMPIPGIPPEYTLLGASGMAMEDVDRIVAEAEAKDAAAAEERSAKRTAKRDAELAKLEASAEAYQSVNVPTIPTLSRLQDLEELYGLEHALPRRPFPPHRKLPLRRVLSVWFVDRMKLFHENVAKLA